MEIASIDRLNAMSAEALTSRLSGSAEERTALVREAAEAGVAEAQALYGQLLLDGNGVVRNQRGAFAWFNKAAAQEHAMALNMVGRCYDLGWGVAIDKARAAECYRVAAERGLEWGMYNYATLLTLGEGVSEDKTLALDWFRKAAALGNAKSANYVGSFYEDGWVVARDLNAAAEHYRIAAEGGDFRGQFNLARLLAARGAMPEALSWLSRVRANATPDFLAKARCWLSEAQDPVLRDEGLRALIGEGVSA